MRRRFGPYEAYVTVLSAGRPEQVAKMARLVGEATWVVPDEEWGQYAQVNFETVGEPGGNVSRARNKCLDLAREHGLPCIMLDDDLRSLKRAVATGKAEPVTFDSAVQHMLRGLQVTGANLAAVNVSTNASWVTQAVSWNTTINGGCLAVKPTRLRFDERLLTSEDIDFALQHYETFVGWLRYDCLLFDFQHRQPGGVQLYRNPEVERRDKELLMVKWPGLLRPHAHPENPHHLRLHMPRNGREVLT